MTFLPWYTRFGWMHHARLHLTTYGVAWAQFKAKEMFMNSMIYLTAWELDVFANRYDVTEYYFGLDKSARELLTHSVKWISLQ